MPRHRRSWSVLALCLAAALAGCGGDGADRPRLTVFAAASLGPALEACAPGFPDADVRLSLAGSDELAAQLRQGVRPDVYAAADAELPAALHEEGLVDKPVAFATNALVLATRRDGPAIAALSQLAEPGVALAIGAPSVPVGAYARAALRRVAIGDEILANARSEEPDATGIVGKLIQGAVDAGFVYATDVEAAGDALRAVELPPAVAPDVVYAAAVVAGADEPGPARGFVEDLRAGACADALAQAGFGPAPAG